MIMISLLYLLIGSLDGPLAQRPAPQACLRYEPDTTAVTGVLTRRMFYGPPGYGEDPKHDSKEPGFYLELSKGVCTVVGKYADLDVPKSDVRSIQLVLDAAGYKRLRPSLGKTITLRGTLFASHTGHHHAELLLTVLRPSSAR